MVAASPGTAAQEADRAIGHTFAIAEAAGFARDDIVYIDLAFADLPEVNESYARHFPNAPPAQSMRQNAFLTARRSRCRQLPRRTEL